MHACQSHNICLRDALSTAEKICHERQLRFTALRRRVLVMIWARDHCPAKAYGLLQQMEHVRIQPPTVYRALKFLLSQGLIHKLSSLNAYVGCRHPLQGHNCYFLICSDCDVVQECCDDKLTTAIQRVVSKEKFHSTYATVEIIGQCRECRSGG